MNLERWSEADRVSLRSFYESGQVWSWSAIENGETAATQNLRSWIELGPAPRTEPVLLPAQHLGQTDVYWYGLAFSDAQADELRIQLNAFLGPFGSDYEGRPARLDATNPTDAAAMQWTAPNRIFRFKVIPAHRAEVRAALERYRSVKRLRPSREASAFRTTEALLREFFAACANVDPVRSQYWLDEIKAAGRLSAENYRFLEIERLGALGAWSELALHPQLSLLVTIRRPRRITSLLVEALLRTEIAQFIARPPVEAIAYVRDRFLPRYEGLLRSWGGLQQPSVILTFLLAAVAATPPRVAQLPLLLAALPSGTREREFGEAAARLVSPSPPAAALSPRNDARRFLALRDFDTAWSYLTALPASIETCEMKLECAAEIFTTEAARNTLAALAELSESDRRHVLQSRVRTRIRDELAALLESEGEARDWETWLDRLSAGPTWPQALTVAHDADGRWSLESYASDPRRVGMLAQRLQDTDPNAASTLRLALPDIATFFLRDAPQAVYLPLYQSLLFLLAVDERYGGEDWGLSHQLLTAILEVGATAVVYADVVDSVTEIWRVRGEAPRLDWALDALDALTVAPVLNAAARDRFFETVRQTFLTHPRRIGSQHRELFRLLCADLGRSADFESLPSIRSEQVFAEDGPELSIHALRGKIVGIYSLTESAAARAKAVIQEQFAGVDVRLNHDFGGSNRLESLAREADYLVVVAKSAKHAATDFIKQKRPRNRSELIYPGGKGSSSIVTALVRAVGLSIPNGTA